MPGRKTNVSGGYADYRTGYPRDNQSHYSNGYTPRADSGHRSSGGGDSGLSHVYNVDHLVTWSIGSEHGVLTHEDGMRQLSKMEGHTGIFTMRCVLTVDTASVQIIDSQTSNAMELFPLECIRDPVAVTDKNGMFNNIALFTVVDEPKNKNSPSDMHIFQVVDRSAKELADDVADAITAHRNKAHRSRQRESSSATTPTGTPTNGNANGKQPVSVKDAINQFEHTAHQVAAVSPKGKSQDQVRVNRRTLESEGDDEEDVKMGVALLNRCFDDVERFVLRLKHSAKAFQELSSRKKHSKGRKYGDGMLTMRSKAPSPAEFIECFQKVKLSFNLLARLRSYLHNPNSIELVHFLFTPLSLLVEASNDPRFDIHDIVKMVVTPLLTKQAVEMLENCLTSKEFEFWSSLGDPWTVPKHRYRHTQGQEFRPKFSDGYQPPEPFLERFLGDVAKQAAREAQVRRRSSKAEEDAPQRYPANDVADSRRPSAVAGLTPATSAQRPTDIPIHTYTDRSPPAHRNGDAAVKTTPWDDYQKSYLLSLQQRNARIYEVIQDRRGNNAKELTIRKGEIVEVVEDNRNWWKCSNINGDQGFVPYTLLNKYEAGDGSPAYSPRGSISSPATPAGAPVGLPAPPPPPPPPPAPAPPVALNSNWRLERQTSAGKVEKSKKSPRTVDSRQSDDFSQELKDRLDRMNRDNAAGGLRLQAALSPRVFIDAYSSADDVADWLKQKGFQENTQRVLQGYNGSELFHLSSDSLTGEFGQVEGSRLVSQIKLMKTTAGYTQSGSSQLRKILERRKQRADGDDGSIDSDELASASALRNGQRSSGRKY